MKISLCVCVYLVGMVIMTLQPPVKPAPVITKSNYSGNNNPPYIPPPCTNETTLICRDSKHGKYEACLNPRAALEQIRRGHATLGECPEIPPEECPMLCDEVCPAACINNVTGPAGEDGQDGQDGQDGSDGQDGQDGQDGSDGQTGATGGCDNCPLTQNLKMCCYISIVGQPASPQPASFPVLGQVIWIAQPLTCSATPGGFVQCDGSSLQIVDHGDLVQLMGHFYGDGDQDDDDAFSLPDTTGMKGIVEVL